MSKLSIRQPHTRAPEHVRGRNRELADHRSHRLRDQFGVGLAGGVVDACGGGYGGCGRRCRSVFVADDFGANYGAAWKQPGGRRQSRETCCTPRSVTMRVDSMNGKLRRRSLKRTRTCSCISNVVPATACARRPRCGCLRRQAASRRIGRGACDPADRLELARVRSREEVNRVRYPQPTHVSEPAPPEASGGRWCGLADRDQAPSLDLMAT